MRRPASAALLALTLLGGMLSVSTVGPMKERKHDKERSHEEHCRQDCRRSGDGDREGNRYCFFPCDFVIVVPAPTAPPGGGDGQQALGLPNLCGLPYHCDPKPQALVPPDPAKLAAAIQAGAAGIGKAAGELAGAIAALPPAILL